MALPRPKTSNIISRPIRPIPKIERDDLQDKLSPQIRNSLHLYLKSLPRNNDDRDRCIKLIQNLDAGITRKTGYSRGRPKSALEQRAMEQSRLNKIYQTSYQSDYPLKDVKVRNATKQHSHGIHFPRQHTSIEMDTTYGKEFKGSAYKRQMPYVGEGSGNTDEFRNNPHPKESFVWWKYPTRPCYDVNELLANDVLTSRPHDITLQDYDRACRGKIRSTYQVDYLALNQGQWDPNIKVTSQQNSHSANPCPNLRYDTPASLPEELKVSTKRYGSNFKKHISSVGMGPEGTTIYRNLRNTTSYDDDFNDYENSDMNMKEHNKGYYNTMSHNKYS